MFIISTKQEGGFDIREHSPYVTSNLSPDIIFHFQINIKKIELSFEVISFTQIQLTYLLGGKQLKKTSFLKLFLGDKCIIYFVLYWEIIDWKAFLKFS